MPRALNDVQYREQALRHLLEGRSIVYAEFDGTNLWIHTDDGKKVVVSAHNRKPAELVTEVIPKC